MSIVLNFSIYRVLFATITFSSIIFEKLFLQRLRYRDAYFSEISKTKTAFFPIIASKTRY